MRTECRLYQQQLTGNPTNGQSSTICEVVRRAITNTSGGNNRLDTISASLYKYYAITSLSKIWSGTLIV